MNDNIKAGADIHAGDGGYRLGTKEGYDAFVKKRNPMNERIKELAIQVQRTEMPGVLFAHPEFVEKFAELIVRECAKIVNDNDCEGSIVGDGMLFEHFGVEE